MTNSDATCNVMSLVESQRIGLMVIPTKTRFKEGDSSTSLLMGVAKGVNTKVGR